VGVYGDKDKAEAYFMSVSHDVRYTGSHNAEKEPVKGKHIDGGIIVSSKWKADKITTMAERGLLAPPDKRHTFGPNSDYCPPSNNATD